ncbi:hypothetical protein Goarm_012674, partial [Gossypium armourianum]|nr:hypothetical protein [Gossypium armourianum]
MDVFHVTDQQGKKITDGKTIDYIERVLGPKGHTTDGMKDCPGKRVGVHSFGNHTAIELIGRDRPGLLSEISAVLANLHFNVTVAEVWTHNRRIACVLYVNDNTTSGSVDDPSRLSIMEEQLKHIMRGCGGVTTEVDYPPSFKPKITVERCEEKGYSVVTVQCKDRAKLMFDIVCTLTDMQ